MSRPIAKFAAALLAALLAGGAHAACNITQVFAGRKNQMLLDVAGSKSSVHWDSEASNEIWVGRRDGWSAAARPTPAETASSSITSTTSTTSPSTARRAFD